MAVVLSRTAVIAIVTKIVARIEGGGRVVKALSCTAVITIVTETVIRKASNIPERIGSVLP